MRPPAVLLYTLALAISRFTCAQQSPVPTSGAHEDRSDRLPQGANGPRLHSETTVDVRTTVDREYRPEGLAIGTLGDVPIEQVPQAALVVSRAVMEDQVARVLSDVTRNDASIGEDYAPVGWYQDFQIRGFPLDLATGFKINGLTIAGEQIVPLENKQSIEILKGLSAVEAGVASPGGLVDYVTKRPADVRSVTLVTDHRGTALAFGDLGHLFGRRQQFGVRTVFGGESIRSYVDGADGHRGFGTVAADWTLDPNTSVRGNFEYQHQVQRSVGGYQLLGGTVVPRLPPPSRLLGEQSWAKPNTFDAFNTSMRFDHEFSSKWKAFVTLGRSRSLLDDNIAYAYGASLAPDGVTTTCPDSPYYFFCPDGSYAVYDYRSPGELRVDDQLRGLVLGQIKTGPLTQDLAVGVNLLRRSVNLPGAVYTFVGNDSINAPNQEFTQDSLAPTPAVGVDHSHQTALVVGDRIHLPKRIDVSINGQLVHVTDAHTTPNPTDRTAWLPQYAVVYRPVVSLSLYGSYGVGLSLGAQAPFWVDVNPSAFLAPYFTRQAEVGAKYNAGSHLLLTGALFRARSPFFYPKLTGNGLEFVSDGRETHRGVEFTAQGKVWQNISLTGSVAAIQGISEHSTTPAFNDQQIINLPHLRSTLSADMAIPHLRGVALLPGWSYIGRKAANRDDTASVPGYNLFNVGVRYSPLRNSERFTMRLFAENVGNKRYWKDTGSSGGDTFLHPGAPATVRLSTQYNF